MVSTHGEAPSTHTTHLEKVTALLRSILIVFLFHTATNGFHFYLDFKVRVD